VCAVEDFGAGPVIEIAIEGKPPVMVPFTRQVVPVVDLAEGRVAIAAIPGLLEAVDERGQLANQPRGQSVS
jgi:16S rRNA processing protein RimM